MNKTEPLEGENKDTCATNSSDGKGGKVHGNRKKARLKKASIKKISTQKGRQTTHYSVGGRQREQPSIKG